MYLFIYLCIYHADHSARLHSVKYADHVIQGFIRAESGSSFHTSIVSLTPTSPTLLKFKSQPQQ